MHQPPLLFEHAIDRFAIDDQPPDIAGAARVADS